MKKSVLLFASFVMLLITFTACSIDEDPKVNFNIAFVAADSVNVPQKMSRGQTYPITVYYKKPDNCHYDDGIYSQRSGSTYIIAIQNIVLNNDDCGPAANPQTSITTFNFTCPIENVDSYTFRFYKGDGENGEQQFIEEEVEVTY